MMTQRNQEKDSNSGVNLVRNLGVVDPGPKNFDFYRQISENFDFFRQLKKFDLPSKHCPFTATSGQIILFLFKSNHFRTYFLYMIRYNNISRPVHDSNDPPATLPATSLSRIWGLRP